MRAAYFLTSGSPQSPVNLEPRSCGNLHICPSAGPMTQELRRYTAANSSVVDRITCMLTTAFKTSHVFPGRFHSLVNLVHTDANNAKTRLRDCKEFLQVCRHCCIEREGEIEKLIMPVIPASTPKQKEEKLKRIKGHLGGLASLGPLGARLS